jgi:hypothetical protein
MSTLGDALKGIRELLLLQVQVQGLERAMEGQSAELKRVANDLIQVDKRLVRIETLAEMGARGRQQPRIEG